MFAVYASEPNPDEPLKSLTVGERPEPEVADGWVAVDVAAASLNMHDLWTLRGVGIKPDQFPMILGCDGAGRLADGTEVVLHPVIGDPGVAGDETLDPKRSLLTEKYQGTFADTVVVPARNAVPKPAGLSMAQAAVMGTAWLTAYRMLFVEVRAPPRTDHAGAGRLRRRRDGAGPARPRGRHAGVGDRTQRRQARRGRAAGRGRHVPVRGPAAGAGGRGVRDRRRGDLGALDAGAQAGRHDRRLRFDQRPEPRARTCSDCSSCSCG